MSTRVSPGPVHPAPSQGPKGIPEHSQAQAQGPGSPGPYLPAQRLSNSDSSSGAGEEGLRCLKDDNLHHTTSM